MKFKSPKHACPIFLFRHDAVLTLAYFGRHISNLEPYCRCDEIKISVNSLCNGKRVRLKAVIKMQGNTFYFKGLNGIKVQHINTGEFRETVVRGLTYATPSFTLHYIHIYFFI